MFIGEKYFSVEFRPENGKFTVKNCIYVAGFLDLHSERNNLVFKQYGQAQNLCDKLNSLIKDTLCTNITK